jgi:antirestriction protein ArdC
MEIQFDFFHKNISNCKTERQIKIDKKCIMALSFSKRTEAVIKTIGEFEVPKGMPMEARNHCFYHRGYDEIYMQPVKCFIHEYYYIKFILHELGHWTANRVNRFKVNGIFDEYAEEAIAELCAIHFCSIFGIKTNLDRFNSYIKIQDPYRIKITIEETKKAQHYLMRYL